MSTRRSVYKKSLSLAVVILAAGKSQRFGSPKQIAMMNGQSLINNCIQNCSKLNVPIFVVLGANRELVKQQIQPCGSPLNFINNPSFTQGLSTSIRAGVIASLNKFDGLLFVTCDQVMVSFEDLNQLTSAWASEPHRMVSARYKGTIGIPAIFPKTSFHALTQLTGDKGAKSLLNSSPHCHVVDIESAAIDIDTPEDLASASIAFKQLCHEQ